MTADGPTTHVGTPVDEPWGELPEGTRTMERGLTDAADPTQANGDAGSHVVVVRLDGDEPADGGSGPGAGDGDDHAGRLRAVREPFPDAAVLTYTVDDDVDAANAAGRHGADYVSGRRLGAVGETLADRVGGARVGADLGGTANDEFLERFLRVTSNRSMDIGEKLDRLLEVGRERLGLTIGFTSRIEGDRYEVLQQVGADELFGSFLESGLIDADGSVPLATTYCRRTVEDGGVTAFTDPERDGWSDDYAYQLFGLETYIGGRVVIDGEVVGTLCFADDDAREQAFSGSERLFVELLAEWLGQEFERRRANDRQEAATNGLENTLERIDDAFFALDDDWTFTYLNEKAGALLDRDPGELVGTHVWSEFPDAIGRTYESAYREAMETQTSVAFEDHYEPLDLWTDVRAYPSEDGLSVFFTDVTDRKRRERRLERLLGTTERLQRVADAEAVATQLVDAAEEVLGYRFNGVELYDEETGLLEVAAWSEGVADRLGTWEPRPLGSDVSSEALETGRHVISPDVTERDDDRDYGGIRSVIAVPLGDHGVFSVGSPESNAFEKGDVSVVKLLATNAAAAFDRVDRQQRLHTYESALENVDDMVCVLGPDGTVTYATPPFADWVGVDRETLVGGPLADRLTIPTAGDAVAGGGANRTRAGALAEAIASLRHEAGREPDADRERDTEREHGNERGRTVTVDVTVREPEREGPSPSSAPDAERKRGELRVSSLDDGSGEVVGSLVDTTDLYRTRTELTRERGRFNRLFERLPDPVIEVVHGPDDTTIQAVNPAFESQFGYEEAAIRGRSISELDLRYETLDPSGTTTGTATTNDATTDGAASSGGTPSEASIDRRVREEGFVTEAIRRRTVDGPREFLFRGFTYETSEETYAFGIYTDVTDREHRERYLSVVNRILRHNLRNELNVVFGFASEIATRTDDETTADYADRIETTAKRLAGLSDGAREMKRIVEQGLAARPGPVRVRPVADAVARRYGETHPDARIDVAVPESMAVHADDRFDRVLGHLVENAIVHGADAPRVSITADDDPERGAVAVRIADDGPGIPAGIREVVSGEAEVTQLKHNSGIGLWIVAWVVEAYGGSVGFEPGLDGEGTTVRLRLPAAERPTED